MPTDEQPTPDVPSGLASSAARTLLSALGGDTREFDAALDQLGLSDADLDGALASGLALGTTVAEQRRAMREHSGPGAGADEQAQEQPQAQGQPHPQAQQPAVHAREVEEDGEFAGLRVLCSDPEATISTNNDLDLLFVQHAGGREEFPLTFEAGEQTVLESESMAESIIRPVGYDVDDDPDPDPDLEDQDDTEDENENENTNKNTNTDQDR